jgi:hypothetical protein
MTFKPKRPGSSFHDWFLSWEDSPSHTATAFQESLLAKGIKMIPHLPCLYYIAPWDCLLFPKLKSELADFLLSQDNSKTKGVGVKHTITQDEFAIAFWQ